MAKFIKVEVNYDNGVDEMYLNVDHITAVYWKENRTWICCSDGTKERTKTSVNEIMEMINK